MWTSSRYTNIPKESLIAKAGAMATSAVGFHDYLSIPSGSVELGTVIYEKIKRSYWTKHLVFLSDLHKRISNIPSLNGYLQPVFQSKLSDEDYSEFSKLRSATYLNQ
jgi:hypothetical protein